jgi:acyl-CoA synthetase (AMP-forming)/AMP-acid ligase II
MSPRTLIESPRYPLSERIRAVVSVDSEARALEFAGQWRPWGALARTIDRVAAVVPAGAEVGLLLRNRPASVGLLLGVLEAGGCAVAINPDRGLDRTRQDIDSLDVAFLAGEADDLALLAPTDRGLVRMCTDELGYPLALRHERRGGTVPVRPGIAVRMLTSGTTGPPKRVDLSYDTLMQVLIGAKHYESNRDTSVRLRSSVAVVNSPLVHLGGLFRVLQCVSDGRPFALLERFTVDAWVDAVRRHRPATASLVPTALRMVLDANVSPEDLCSLRSVVSGTAPLSPDDAENFTARYGIPVLSSYAATEFGGSVAGWNIEDYRAFRAAKRGSVGRAHSGSRLRVVAAETGQVLAADEEGVLEVKAGQLGSDSPWIRTTDQARIDADGFLWILGREDQAIIRGGFKVRPNDVSAALERHRRVRAAAVVSRPDPRLGAVPVAAVELRPGTEPVTPEELLVHASRTLARYELPAEIRIVDELPRTPSAKVDLTAVAALFSGPTVHD